MTSPNTVGMAFPDTVGGIIAARLGVNGQCRECGHEKTLSAPAFAKLPLPRELTLGKAGTKLKCRDCGERQIILTAVGVDPQAPLQSQLPSSSPAREANP